jgi:hypothetical protein
MEVLLLKREDAKGKDSAAFILGEPGKRDGRLRHKPLATARQIPFFAPPL